MHTAKATRVNAQPQPLLTGSLVIEFLPKSQADAPLSGKTAN
jgi:hypothetical protein